jgi:hypothetical protein
MPKDYGMRDREFRMLQLKQRHAELSFMLADIESNITNFQNEIDEEIILSQLMDQDDKKIKDMPRVDDDEHPTILMETGNGKSIPYFFTEYKKITNYFPYEYGMSGYNWNVASAVADECKRPLIYVEYNWDDWYANDDDMVMNEGQRMITFFVYAANQYAKDRFDELEIPHQISCSQYQFVYLSHKLRDKSTDKIVENKNMFMRKRADEVTRERYWKRFNKKHG